MKSANDDTDLLRRTLLALLPGLTLADGAWAQDATKSQPDSFRVVLENEQVRVLDFLSRPGMAMCGVGMHSHPRHLTVALSAAKVRVTTADGKRFIAENKPGDVFWSEAETHATENLMGHDARALLVEFKSTRS
jgi:hypothetical protein